MFRPLKHRFTVSVSYDDSIDMSDLNIDPEIKEVITQHVATLSVDNHSQTEEDCNGMAKSFHKLYKRMSGLPNYSNDSLRF